MGGMISAVLVGVNPFREGEIMNLKKPPHVSDKAWKQHMDWMELMDGQVKANREARVNRPPSKVRTGHSDGQPERS